MKLPLLCVMSITIFTSQAMDKHSTEPTTKKHKESILVVHLVQKQATLAADSPLHAAARNGNYEKCFALLTAPSWSKDELPQEAFCADDATYNAWIANYSEDPTKQTAKKAAIERVRTFVHTTRTLVAQHMGLVKARCNALNAEGKSPYAIALESKPCDERLVTLLDSSDAATYNTLSRAVAEKLAQRLADGNNSSIFRIIALNYLPFMTDVGICTPYFGY